MNTLRYRIYLALVLALSMLPLQAAEESTAGSGGFSQAELDQMMAPVALYPDSLLSQVLMASTYPDQVAQAAAWSKANPKQQGDAAVEAVQDKDWDPSVASLVAFPQVLATMGEKPDWVKQMGDAFLAEPEKVMDTVQGLRNKAKEAGNLESSEQQKVMVEGAGDQSIVIIKPADPQVIYVPTYNPTIIYGPWWWPAYPPFYYRPPGYGFAAGVATGIGFGVGIAITNSIWGNCNWRSRDININVNRYNNINKKLNVNNTNVSWKKQTVERRERARTDLGKRTRPDNRLQGADKRKEFRGRDAERKRAQQALKSKGMDPAAERKKLSGSGGERVREKVAKSDRGGIAGAKAERRDGGAAAKARDRSSSAPKRRDNALKGVGSGNRAGLSSERGRASNRSFERHSGGGGRAGGGRAGGRLGRD